MLVRNSALSQLYTVTIRHSAANKDVVLAGDIGRVYLIDLGNELKQTAEKSAVVPAAFSVYTNCVAMAISN